MPRTVADAKLQTRSSRLRLKERREPYWRSLSKGLAIGYRRTKKGGTWIARHYAADTGRRFGALGTADDIVEADGVHILSFDHAQAKAREWVSRLAVQDDPSVAKQDGPYTVASAMILDHGDGEPEVACHPRRSRHAVVGGEPDHY